VVGDGDHDQGDTVPGPVASSTDATVLDVAALLVTAALTCCGCMCVMREDARGRSRTILPSLTLLVVAPVFGEVLSTATAPLDILLPWNLALVVGMYGCGALLCREVAHRYRLGWPGLLLLGAAYGVYEEGLVDRFWYDPSYWDEVGVGDYSVVWHINVLIATHLTIFHTAVSIVASIVVPGRPTELRAWGRFSASRRARRRS
jgi:hypothetical protein